MTTFAQRTCSVTLTFDHMTWNSEGNIYSLGTTKIPILTTLKQRGKKNFFICSFVLSFDHVNWKSPSGVNHCSLEALMRGSHKILSRQNSYKDLKFDLDLWPCDLKINRQHLISKVSHCTKFDNSQAKGSKDIEWTTLGQQIDKLIDQYVPSFSSEGI